MNHAVAVKVIFLDIDGVLNSRQSWAQRKHGSGTEAIDPDAMARLNRLLRQSGASIVVSSSWRSTVARTREVLCANGLCWPTRVIGCTPRSEVAWGEHGLYVARQRGDEIQAWLDQHPDRVRRFVILDDGDDMGPLRRSLVQTNPDVGLTDADVERALALLEAAG